MKLTELFELDDQLPEGAETLLPEGALPPEEESRVLARLLDKAGSAAPEKGEKTTMKKTRFGLALFAAALCAGTIAASAAAYFQADKGLLRKLGAESESWQEFLNGSGAAIQASQECGGWTLTVDQAVGDRNCAYILLDLTAPEGTVLGADLYRLDCMLEFDSSKSGGWGCRMLEDEDKTDNKLAFLIHTAMDGDLRDTTGHLKVTGIMEYTENGEGPDDDVVNYPADLEWNFDFPMRYKNDPIVYKPDRTVPVEGGELKVKRVEVTPLSVLVRIVGDEELLERVEPFLHDGSVPGTILLEIRDREGDRLGITASGGRHGLGSLDEIVTFVPIIDPDNVAAVALGGAEVPLE